MALTAQYFSVPVNSVQNLDFEPSEVGIENDIATFFMFIPFAFITDYKDMRKFDLRLLNPEKFDAGFLSQLQFFLKFEGKPIRANKLYKISNIITLLRLIPTSTDKRQL